MEIEKIIFILIMLSIIILGGCTKKTEITNFEDCINAGNPIMESYPRQCTANGQTFTEEINKLRLQCESENGTWINTAKECEGISKQSCDKLGGTFNECASACRNNPDAEICTMQCVIVCSFK